MSRPVAHSIVTDRSGPYLRLVIVRRLLALLVLAGLVLAPLGMPGGSSAVAMSDHTMSAADGADPCAGHQDPNDGQAPDDCCVMACAAIAATGEELSFNAVGSGHHGPRPLARDPRGLAPEAEPPPPRRS